MLNACSQHYFFLLNKVAAIYFICGGVVHTDSQRLCNNIFHKVVQFFRIFIAVLAISKFLSISFYIADISIRPRIMRVKIVKQSDYTQIIGGIRKQNVNFLAKSFFADARNPHIVKEVLQYLLKRFIVGIFTQNRLFLQP